MSKTYVVFAGDTPDAPLTWCAVSAQGNRGVHRKGRLADLADAAAGEPVILVLAGHWVTAHALALAARSEAQARLAAPYAIEDEVACDPDGLHIALSPPRRTDAGTKRLAFAVERALIEDWLATLTEAGLRVGAIYADHMLVPSRNDALVTVSLAGRTLIRDGAWSGAVDHALGADVTSALLAARSNGRPVVSLASETGVHVGDPEGHPGDPYDVLAGEAVRGGWSLRQGALAERKAGTDVDLRRWVSAGAVAAAAFVAVIATNLAEGFSLRAEANALEAETAALIRETFPEVNRIVNPRAQVRSLTETPGAGRPDFLILSAFLTDGVATVPAVEIEALRFDAERGELSASVLFERYDDLAALREQLEQAGAQVEEGGSRQEGTRRAGELMVRLP